MVDKGLSTEVSLLSTNITLIQIFFSSSFAAKDRTNKTCNSSHLGWFSSHDQEEVDIMKAVLFLLWYLAVDLVYVLGSDIYKSVNWAPQNAL